MGGAKVSIIKSIHGKSTRLAGGAGISLSEGVADRVSMDNLRRTAPLRIVITISGSGLGHDET